MKPSPEEYRKMSENAAPHSPFLKNFTFAFLIGGLICALGEGLILLYQAMGLDAQTAPTLASVTLIGFSVVLTGLNVYDDLAKIAGAGTLVPITGFANAVASPAMEFKSEGLILGLGAKMFTIAGPVIVYGTAASVLYGLILYCFHLY